MKKTKKSSFLLVLILAFVLALLQGCGEEPKKAEPPKAPPKAASPAAAAPKPASPATPPQQASPSVKPVQKPEQASPSAALNPEDMPYSPKGKTDPFKSYIVVASPHVAKEKAALMPPLQRLPAEQYKLVGIVYTGKKDSKAIVTDDTGRGYVIMEGTEIGQNKGKVVKIMVDRIIVLEKFKDTFGDIKSREISLQLRASEGGM